MRYYLLSCVALSLGAVTAYGSVGGSDLEVLHWEKTAPRELRLEVIEVRDKARKIIHVRCRPLRISHFRQQRDLIPAAEAEYDRAFNLLCQELQTTKTICVLLDGERGYSQIRNRKGHFRTEMIEVVPPSRYGLPDARICFYPPDLDSESPD
jgi:hypothetical protein